MSMVPLSYACLGFLVGIFPGWFDRYLGTPMATAISGSPLQMKLKLWHGLNPEAMIVLALSLFTLLSGLFVAKRIKPIILYFENLMESFSKYSFTKFLQSFHRKFACRRPKSHKFHSKRKFS